MSKKIHICATKNYSKEKVTQSRIFCGATQTPTISYITYHYMYSKRVGHLDDSRMCKACLDRVPMYILSTL